MATCIPVLYTQSSEAIIKTFGQMFQWHFVILGFMYWAWAIIVRSENFMSFNFSQMNVKSELNQCFELSYVTEDILTNQLLGWHRYCGASLQQLFAPSVQLCSAQTSLLQVDITLNTSIISLLRASVETSGKLWRWANQTCCYSVVLYVVRWERDCDWLVMVEHRHQSVRAHSRVQSSLSCREGNKCSSNIRVLSLFQIKCDIN